MTCVLQSTPRPVLRDPLLIKHLLHETAFTHYITLSSAYRCLVFFMSNNVNLSSLSMAGLSLQIEKQSSTLEK